MLIFAKWFRDLLSLHFDIDKPITINMHVRTLENLEVDITISQGQKIVAIELKERDYIKAIKQAQARRKLFDYMYVALDLPTCEILSILRTRTEAISEGIGFISTYDDCIVLKSYKRKTESSRYTKIMETIK